MKKLVTAFGIISLLLSFSFNSIEAKGYVEKMIDASVDNMKRQAQENLDDMTRRGGNSVVPDGSFTLPESSQFGNEIGANTDAKTFALKSLNFFLSFLGVIAIGAMVYAGFLYITTGSEDNEKAKKIILYTSVGIIVILSSYAFVNTIIKQGGSGGTSSESTQVSGETISKINAWLEITIDEQAENTVKTNNYGKGLWIQNTDKEVQFVINVNSDSTNKTDVELTSLNFDFGDGTIENGSLIETNDNLPIISGKLENYKFNTEGVYTLIINANVKVEEDARTLTKTIDVIVGPTGIANFSFTPAQPKLNKTGNIDVNLNADVSAIQIGRASEFKWSCEKRNDSGSGSCPDFSQKQIQKPQITFNGPGIFDIKLIITTSLGDTLEISKPIEVLDKDSTTIEILEPKNNDKLYVGEEIRLTAKIPSEYVNDVTTIKFVDEDGKIVDSGLTCDPNSLSGRCSVNWTPDAEKTDFLIYAVATITNSTKEPVSAPIEVDIVPINAEMNVSLYDKLGANNYKIEVATKNVAVSGYKYEILYNKKTILSQSSSSPTAYFDLSETKMTGTKKFTFKSTIFYDENKKYSLTEDKSINIVSDNSNNKPTGDIIIVPSNTGTIATNFTFFAQGADKDRDNLSYKWIFPSNNETNNANIEKTGQTVNFRFTKPQTVDVTLEISDSFETTSITKTINVLEDPNKTAETNVAPTITINGMTPGNTGSIDTRFEFYITGEDENKDHLTYKWDMGDGVEYFVQNVAHKYRTPGTYTATVTVSDGIDEAQEQITVIVVARNAPIPESTIAKFSAEDLPKTTLPDVAIGGGNTADSALDTEEQLNNLEIQKIQSIQDAIAEETDPVKKAELNAELQSIMKDSQNEEIQKLYDLQEQIESETDPAKKAELEKTLANELENVETKSVETNSIKTKEATYNIAGTTETTYFLYGELLLHSNSALFFEWKTSDGQVMYGQNAKFKFPKAGEYEVTLTVSNESRSVSKTRKIIVKD